MDFPDGCAALDRTNTIIARWETATGGKTDVFLIIVLYSLTSYISFRICISKFNNFSHKFQGKIYFGLNAKYNYN